MHRRQYENIRLGASVSRRRWLGTAAAAASAGLLRPAHAPAAPASSTQPAPGAPAGAETGWWSWRGPFGSNVAASDAFKVTSLGEARTLWETPIPGRGHSSPIVTDRSVYLTTADTTEEAQLLLAVDRATGKLLWNRVVHLGGLPEENHRKNTEASPTAAFDGSRVLVSFYNSDAIQVTAYTPEGEELWQRPVGPYSPQRFKYGYAASPVIYGDTVIIVGEYDGPAFLTAVSLRDGSQVWKVDRPNATSFSSPIVAHLAGRDQLLLSGSRTLTSYDPADGRTLWQAPASAMATCGTAVWHDDLVFVSGGFPESETACVRADGSGRVLWKNGQKCYEQSMLTADGHLYAVTDQGIAYCWRCSDGTLRWRERLGGNYSSSPLLVGDRIYVFNEACDAFCFRADPRRFERLGEDKLGDEAFATPAVVDDVMYMRIARNESGRRQEYLLALR